MAASKAASNQKIRVESCVADQAKSEPSSHMVLQI
jgi:hypothetical protein